MQNLRKELLSVPDNTFNAETKKLNRHINKCSEGLELTKMKFRSEVVQYIESIHTEEVDWLKDSLEIDVSLNIIPDESLIQAGKDIVLSNEIKNMLQDYRDDIDCT